MYHALLHERRHAHGIAVVVAKSKKSTAVGNESAMQAHAVHDRGHPELTHAIAHVIASAVAARDDAAFEVRQVRSGEIGRAAKSFGQGWREAVEHDLGCLAARKCIRTLRELDSRSARGLKEC